MRAGIEDPLAQTWKGGLEKHVYTAEKKGISGSNPPNQSC